MHGWRRHDLTRLLQEKKKKLRREMYVADLLRVKKVWTDVEERKKEKKRKNVCWRPLRKDGMLAASRRCARQNSGGSLLVVGRHVSNA